MTSPSILVIEDDPTVGALLAEALHREGYPVSIAEDGAAGLKLFRDHAFNLVVTDIFMPQMDGIEVIMQVRAMHPETRIIATSAGGRVGDAQTLLRAAQCLGAHAVVEKPFSVEEVLSVVRAALDGALIRTAKAD